MGSSKTAERMTKVTGASPWNSVPSKQTQHISSSFPTSETASQHFSLSLSLPLSLARGLYGNLWSAYMLGLYGNKTSADRHFYTKFATPF